MAQDPALPLTFLGADRQNPAVLTASPQKTTVEKPQYQVTLLSRSCATDAQTARLQAE